MSATHVVALLVGVLLGLGVGLVGGFRLAQLRGLGGRERDLLDLAESRFREAGVRATGELESRRQAVEHLVAPLRETLAKVEGHLHELESTRLEAYSRLTEQVATVARTSEQLRSETTSLVSALRAPQARGQWGEMQLRRVVELSGMVEHCDFQEQVSVSVDGVTQRPDMVVRLAGGKSVVVDAKVSLAAYLTAAETTDDGVRRERLKAHARHLRAHVDDLATKEYWTAFQPSPELVVLFIPGEAFLAPALEQDPALLEHAMAKRVVIATPTTLIALLRTVGYAWQQDALTANAREVFEVGRELYRRLATMGGHVDKLGRSLRRTVDDYNATVGSLERNVLVQARRLADLRVTDLDLPSPSPIDDAAVRPVAAGELIADAVAGARELRVVGGHEGGGD